MCQVSDARLAFCDEIRAKQSGRQVKAQPDPEAMRLLTRLVGQYGADLWQIVDEYLRGVRTAESLQAAFQRIAYDRHREAHLLGQDVADTIMERPGLATNRGTEMAFAEQQYFRGFINALESLDSRYFDPETGWKREKIAKRVEAYLPKAEASAGVGWLDGHPAQAQFDWILGAADHCFPGHAQVATPGGSSKRIDQVKVGDLVSTRLGPRRVSRVMISPAPSKMMRISTAQGVIECTENHPLLTARGWVAAGRVKASDLLVRVQGALDPIHAEIAFPYPNDREALRFEHGVRLPVPGLLRDLPISQRIEAGMAVPVFPVALDDKSANAGVSKAVAGKRVGRLKIDAQFHQEPLKPPFRRRYALLLVTMLAFMQSPKNAVADFRVGLHPSLNLGPGFGPEHRVIGEHVFARSTRAQLCSQFGVECEPRLARSGGNHLGRDVELCCDSGGTFGLIPISNGRVNGFPVGALSVLGATSAFPVADVPANGAYLAFDHRLGGRVGLIPASDGAESAGVVAALSEALPAKIANGLYLCSIHSIELCRQEATEVYNLEVEEAHEYVVEGFVVHNCDDCPVMAMSGPYYRETLFTMPRSGDTACLYRCKCRVETIEGVASFDPVEYRLVQALGLAA